MEKKVKKTKNMRYQQNNRISNKITVGKYYVIYWIRY